MWVWPCTEGTAVMIAGRSTLGSILRTKRAVAIRAPVLPALTQAWASPLLTRSMATRMDESFLPRRALEGDSSIATVCEVWRILSRAGTLPPNSDRISR